MPSSPSPGLDRETTPETGARWTLTLGDCLDPVTGLASLPDKSVDCFIFDPPYSKHVHSQTMRGLTVTHRGGKRDEIAARRVLGFNHITQDERRAMAVQCARLARRWVLSFSDVESSHLWSEAFTEAGLQYLRTVAWIKIGGAPQFTGDRPAVGFEAIVCAHPAGKKRWNGGGKAGVYRFPTAIDRDRSGLDRRIHTAQKPLKLMEALISDFTDPGDLVCDPYAGGGTTAFACNRLGRRFMGWERDPASHAAAIERLNYWQAKAGDTA